MERRSPAGCPVGVLPTAPAVPVHGSAVGPTETSGARGKVSRVLYFLTESNAWARVPSACVVPASIDLVGAWLSLVEHLVRDQGVGGSNPLAPTNLQ